MVDEAPRLRVVQDGEKPPPPPTDPDRAPKWWRSPALGVVLATIVLLVGLGVGIWFLFGRDGSHGPADAVGSGSTSADQPAFEATTVPPTIPPSSAPPSSITSNPGAPGSSTAGLTLVPVPVAGSTLGGPTSSRVTPPPSDGTVSIRLFNGFTPGQSLDVWEVSGRPQKYGSLHYGGYAAIEARGALVPTGVALHLRFVRSGGDPLATGDPIAGPWSWNLVPTVGSRQTLVLVNDGGLHITRIDDRRAAGAVNSGSVHIVPIAQQLQIGGSRELRWGLAGFGCNGVTTADKGEFDLPPSAPVQLSGAHDLSCASAVAGPVTLPVSGAVAAIALPAGGGRADLVVLPLA
jgi:hypothetical protein